MSKKEKISKIAMFKRVAWNFSSISNGFMAVLLGYLNYYLTENVMLSAGAVGMALMASKFFDGFTDLIAGYIIERTHTRWGKGRPYALCSALMWPFVILLFSVPSFFSTTGKIVYVFICYLLIQSVFQTLYSCSDGVYMLRAFPEEKERAGALALGGLIVTYSCKGIVILMPVLIALFGDKPYGWTMIAVVLGVPAAILSFIKFLVIKEQPIVDDQGREVKENKATIKQMVSHIVHNKYALLCLALWMCFQLGQNLTSVVQSYFYSYYLGNIALLSLIGMTTFVSPFITLFIPSLQSRFGKTKVIKAGILLSLVAAGVRAMFPTTIPVLMGASIFIAAGTLPLNYFFGLFLMDCMDYGEWKLGYRVESCYTAVQSTAQKISSGLASGLAGAFMGFTGFVSGAETQSAGALQGIYLLMMIAPLIIYVVVLIILHFYKLDNQIAQIKEELLVKRGQ